MAMRRSNKSIYTENENKVRFDKKKQMYVEEKTSTISRVTNI